MDFVFQKTGVFIFFIFIGVLLKFKFHSKDEILGIKKIILNLALPATIFIALMGVTIEPSLLALPLLALLLNCLSFFVFPFLLPLLGVTKDSPNYRTARLLMPSLAPGLSCFPFVLEFLGESYLAKAAMADLGNKVFVLIFLYFIAMNWHYRLVRQKQAKKLIRLGGMLKILIAEPINLFIFSALLFLGFGVNMESIPFIFKDSLEKLSLIMTPLVLLFIGLAVKIKKEQFFQVFSLLCFRASFVVLLSGIFVAVSGISNSKDILLLLAFGLSSCSFWPYAHISTVDNLEKANKPKHKTFNSDFAIAILALSFPFSTLLILGLLNSGTTVTSYANIFLFGMLLGAMGLVLHFFNNWTKMAKAQKLVNPKLDASVSDHLS
ncbi:MAG: permease [Bacteroidota bacterium]